MIRNLLLSTQGVSWISKILDKMDSWNQSDDGRFELGCVSFPFTN